MADAWPRGPTTAMRHWRAEARGKRGVSACGIYVPDLEQLRQPDLPPGLGRLRVD